MTAYAAVITFPENAVAYEALTKLRSSSAAAEVTAAVLVERQPNGQLVVPDADNREGWIGTGVGSAVGMLVGVLGGPIGMLLGLTAGASFGALYDADRVDTGDAVVEKFARLVPPGRNAIIAQTDEADENALNAFVSEFGGRIERRPLDEVLGELEAQQEAAEAAARAANDELRKKKRDERHEKLEERLESLRAKFSHKG